MRSVPYLFFVTLLLSCQFVEVTLEISVIKTVDTDFSKCRIGLEHDINLKELEKFHGHVCDGLVAGFQALHEAFKVLYPREIIDRTNTRILSKASPCLADTAIYRTGGRYQFNTFYVSNDIKGLFVV
jgi:formylmethanofuran dehydrogenase subunit E